jgi:lipoprotein-anchoring transpeptidase ErfK/SrfK
VAVATASMVPIFDAPGATEPRDQLDNPWFVNGDPRFPLPLLFHVESTGVETGEAAGWLNVLLPTRPNGSTGWVRATDVTLQTVAFRVVVELGEHRLTVYQDDQVVLKDTVAVGKPSTPTPLGRSYIRALLQPPNRNSPYGPYAFGLSGHSEVLDRFLGGDAEIGIHGNNDASVLGQDVSSGCIRMSNDKVTELANMLPLGTPVLIRA